MCTKSKIGTDNICKRYFQNYLMHDLKFLANNFQHVSMEFKSFNS